MSRRRYKNYLREEEAVIPRTSHWRSECQNANKDVYNWLEDNESQDESLFRRASSMSSNQSDVEEMLSGTDTDTSCSFDCALDIGDNDDSDISFELSSQGNTPHPLSTSSENSFNMHCISIESEDNCQTDDEISNNSFTSDNNDDFGFISGGNESIYEGASLSHNQSLLLLMAFVLRHNLTDQALDDFLSVMNIHLPNVVPDTKYLFHKKFYYKTFTKHYFCPDCKHYFGPSDNCDLDDKCSCSEAKSVEAAKKQNWYFSYWKVQSQLELLLQDDDIAGSLLNRVARPTDSLQDCTDGKMFAHLKHVYGYGPNDISLLWNIDGVPVFRSSSQDLWPIQCTVLELPIEKRKNNIIMPALWFCKSKVDMSLLMRPFVEEIELLSTKGFMFNGQCVRVFAPICTADAPARPKVRNAKQFNGKYGCDWCLHPGELVGSGRGHARAYPYVGPQKQRTHQSTERSAVEALELRSPKLGVKGPSVLSCITHFDLINGFVPDFLHCVLLGVARQMTKLWFESTNHESEWYIGQPAKQNQYDQMVKGTIPPKEIRRLPRSISARDHWKGNEYKTFVLYYSLILLEDLLPKAFLNHYFLFVWSLHVLLGTSISSVELVKVGAVLDYFCLKMEELYGLNSCTFNVHQLSHLAKSTEMCGPLWSVSTFVFESNNGTLKRMVQGTQYVSSQICNTYAVMKTMPFLVKQCVNEDDQVETLLQKLVSGKSQTESAVKLGKNLLALSKPKVRKLTDEEILSIRVRSNKLVNQVAYEYNRFIWDGKCFDTAAYTRSSKRQNHVVKAAFDENTIRCKVKSLVTVKECACEIQHHEQCACHRRSVLFCMPYNVVSNNMYKCAHFNIVSDFISEVTESPERVIVLPLEAILTKCVVIVKGYKTYLVDMPNMVEME